MSELSDDRARTVLRSLFDTAVAASMPANCMPRWMPARPEGRVVVVGAGKAAASMAKVLENEWAGPLDGRVIVPYGHEVTCDAIDVVAAAHPVPDAAGSDAALSILDTVSNLTSADTVVCLISGGGSSLLCVPAPGVTLEDKQEITAAMLTSGAEIHEINTVRKKLSAIKGGKLAAAAAPARVITLIISDVPGNDVSMVASGPTVSDSATPDDALEILHRYNVDIPDHVRVAVQNSPPLYVANGDIRILATSDDAILAAAELADQTDITPYSLGDLHGDAATLAIEHAALAMDIVAGRGPVTPPCVILSGGETTVTITGNGRGGRNGEYALSLAAALGGHSSIYAIACDTDGIDGSGDNAGCVVTPSTLMRATEIGLNIDEAQQQNDSYRYFSALGDLVVTGPTLTNTNDFRAIFIG